MTKEQFIENVAKYVKQYAPLYGIKCYSAVISQAILESACGTSELATNANNFFGLKYREGRCPTAIGTYYKVGSEQDANTGQYVSSNMKWFKFSDFPSGIQGYFDFINIGNYKNLKCITNPRTYLETIKNDGYCTSIKYVQNCLNVIDKYDLTKYDVKGSDNDMAYTNSSLVSYTKISPNKTSPRNHTIDCITIHCMAGNLTVETCGNVFAKVSRKASSNYGIGTDGRIAMYVEEKDRSWCSSNSANDNRAITIEVANDGGAETGWHVSDKAMDSLIKLCADICKRNNIKELKWSTNKSDRVNHKNGCNMTVHRDFATKSCPGAYLYEKHGYIADEVNKLLGVKSSITSSNPLTTPSTEKTYTVQKGDTLSKIGTKTGISWKTIAELNGIKSPYVVKIGQVLKLSNTTTTNSNNSNTSAKKYISNGIDYSLVFDPTYYANKYADLKAAFGTDANKLFGHFIDFGLQEGRQAISTFNVTAYKNRYADLQKAFGNDLPAYYRHYITNGKSEGRSAV